MYQFTCFPNGLTSAPRDFTKLTKVFFAELRKKGYINTSYIDNCLLIGGTRSECRENICQTVLFSKQAGFMVHPVKSVLEPQREIVYLGFVLNSIEMAVRLTDEKALRLKSACSKLK